VDATEVLREQFTSVRRFVDGILDGLTDEHLNCRPPGTANPIGVSWLHLLTVEDGFIQGTIQGTPRLWESQEWTAKTGIYPRASDETWDRVKQTRFAVAPLRAYGEAVREATDAYLSSVTADQLARVVTVNNTEMSVARLLTMMVCHSAGHAGDIAAIKGIQGLKGLPR
jgi:hypothetical protein